MNNQQRLPEYLSHIRQAATDACAYLQGMTKADFLADKRTQQAIVMNLLIIGKAATKLLQDHADFTDRHPVIPWRNMKGMRNRIAHGYFEINLDVVWETTQTSLPSLLMDLPLAE